MASISPSLAALPMTNFPSLFSDIRQMQRPLKETEGKRLYFATNEANIETTIATLERMPVKGNIVLAVSGIFSLNILAARIQAAQLHGREISGLVIVDRSPIVQTFWKYMNEIIRGEPGKDAPTRLAVISRMGTLISEKNDYFFDTASLDPLHRRFVLTYNLQRFRNEIETGISFASSDEKFERVQKIFRTGYFTFLRLDLTAPASFQALASVLQANGFYVDTAYFSNILQFVPPENLGNFHASTEAIMSSQTIVVDTNPVCACETFAKGYVQRVRERQGLPASALFIPAVHDDFSGGLGITKTINFVLDVARRTIGATYTYFTGTTRTQAAAKT